ncbi:MAG: ferredoxin--NADP reductase [Pseudomonadota bacterium]
MAFGDVQLPKTVTAEEVLSVRHWTDDLFQFRLTRPDAFRFRAGEFIMVGLMVDGKPLLRAYSVASPTWDEGLDFYSIKVQDGPLTSRLQHIKPGDHVLLGKKPTGTLVLDALAPGKRLFFFSTGTGVAPFASLIREPETYEKFDHVILTHTCRRVVDLAYSKHLVDETRNDPLVGELVGDALTYYATTTREPFEREGRITDLIDSGKFFEDLAIPGFDPENDRIMICGSSAMLADTAAICEKNGFEEGANNNPSTYVIEKAFVG